MTTQVVSTSGVSASASIKVLPGNPFNIGFGAIVSGAATYTIQHTFDGSNWFDHEELVNATTSQDGNYAFPVAGVRVDQTIGAGSVTLTTLQAR